MTPLDVVPQTVRMTDTEWFQLVTVVTAVLVLGATLYRYVVRPTARLVRRTSEFLEDWQGTPARPGRPAQPGAMERLRQLENNGGTSIKDVVEQTRALVEHTRADVQALHERDRAQWAVIRRLERYHREEETHDQDHS